MKIVTSDALESEALAASSVQKKACSRVPCTMTLEDVAKPP